MASPARGGLADRTTALVGWTIAWRAAGALTTLGLSAVLVRRLPTAEYGRYTLVLSVLVYLALVATFGQDQACLRYLPELLGRGDRSAAYDVLRKSAVSILLAWATTSAAVWLLRPAIDGLLRARIADLLALGTILLLAGIASGTLSFALVAIYDMRSQALATPAAGVITLFVAVLFLQRGGGLGSVLLAGAIGQTLLAGFYLFILLRRIRRTTGVAGPRIGWGRLLVYASGWLPSLLIASAVGLQFESLFLLRFRDTTAVAYYDTGYNIPQRLVSLIPSFLTGAWVVGTLEGLQREGAQLRAAVRAFYKGIFLIAFPLALSMGALLGPLIQFIYTRRLHPAAEIAPWLLAFFVAALLATPWGLVVRVRELAWVNAGVSAIQLAFSAVADLWLIQRFGLWGAVAGVALTTVLTLAVTLGAWQRFAPDSISLPWSYALRCLGAALPYGLLFPLARAGLSLPLLLGAAVLLGVAWLALVRRLGLLERAEVPLLHQSRHAAVRWGLRWLVRETY